MQKTLFFQLDRAAGEAAYRHALREHDFNSAESHIPPGKLLCDLVKRQAALVMKDVTECPPVVVNAHLARLDAIREVIGHLMRHDCCDNGESSLSGGQLLYPRTLADFDAALRITREQHRAPVFVTERDEQLTRVERKLDILAGLFSSSGLLERELSKEDDL
jgi:hypothetical protein